MSTVASTSHSLRPQSLPAVLVECIHNFLPQRNIAISRCISTWFNHYPKAVHLDLSGLPKDVVLKVIAQYRKHCAIHSIDTGEMQWTDLDIVQLQGLALKALSLSGIEMSEAGIKILAELPIEILSFKDMGDLNKNLGLLTKMPLRQLTLIDDDLGDTGFKHFERMSLEKLHIYGGEYGVFCTIDSIKSLSKLPLKDLKIVGCYLTYTQALSLKALPLEKLSIDVKLLPMEPFVLEQTLTAEQLALLAKEIPTLKQVEYNGFPLSQWTKP